MVPLLVALLALAAPSPAPARAAEAAALPVRGGPWTGSAVVWDGAAGLLLTALHVVEEMPPDGIEVVTEAGPLPARVVDREPALDLALLQVGAPLAAGPRRGSGAALTPGAPLTVAACPAGRCERRPGRLVEPSRAYAGSRYLVLGAAVAPGASGGAVLDDHGDLVGVVDLALLREPGTALAVPVERALARFRPATGPTLARSGPPARP